MPEPSPRGSSSVPSTTGFNPNGYDLDKSIYSPRLDLGFRFFCFFIAVLATTPYPFFAIKKDADHPWNITEFFLSALFNICLYYYYNEERFREFPVWMGELSNQWVKEEKRLGPILSVSKEASLLALTTIAGAGAQSLIEDLPMLAPMIRYVRWNYWGRMAYGIMNVPGMKKLLEEHGLPSLRKACAHAVLVLGVGRRFLLEQYIDEIRKEVFRRLRFNVAGSQAPSSDAGDKIATSGRHVFLQDLADLPKNEKNPMIQAGLMWGVWSVFALIYGVSNMGGFKNTWKKSSPEFAIISIMVSLAFGLKLLASSSAEDIVYGHKALGTRSGKVNLALFLAVAALAYGTAVGATTTTEENYARSPYLLWLIFGAVIGTIYVNASGALGLLFNTRQVALAVGKLVKEEKSAESLFDYRQATARGLQIVDHFPRQDFLKYLQSISLDRLINHLGFEPDAALKVYGIAWNKLTEDEVEKFYSTINLGHVRAKALLNILIAIGYRYFSTPELEPSLGLLPRLACVGALGFVAPAASLVAPAMVRTVNACRGQQEEAAPLMGVVEESVSKNASSFWSVGKAVFNATVPVAACYAAGIVAESLSIPPVIAPWLVGSATVLMGVYQPLLKRL